MATLIESHFKDPVSFVSSLEIPSDAFSVSEDVILKAVGFYKPFNGNHSFTDERTTDFHDLIETKKIVICQPIFELLHHRLYPDKNPLSLEFGSNFHRKPEIVLNANFDPDKVPEPLPFCVYNWRLRECRKKTKDLLSRDNVYVPVSHAVSIPERWQVLQMKVPSMTEDALKLVRRGLLCNTHGQYLVESYSRSLPILSLNYREIISAAEMLGIGKHRKNYGSGLVCCYNHH